MTMMQGGDLSFWFWITLLLSVLSVLCTWYFTITGRDRKPRHQRRGEETIERYGTVTEDRAPLSKFLIVTYIGVIIWSLGYLFWTGFMGLGT